MNYMNIITLTNGKKVANFSSPHSFTFTDGTVLPAVSNELAEDLKVEFIETEVNLLGDVMLDFKLTTPLQNAILAWMQVFRDEKVDVVFCPLPMITAMKLTFGYDYVLDSPFRSVRIEDRINKLVSIDKQCI